MANLLPLSLSMIYILLVLGLATLVAKYTEGASENSRKLVHILVGNWVFLLPLFTDLWAVLLVPAVFVVVNSLSLRYKLIPAMERDDDSLGTVFYAISMLLLSGAGYLMEQPLLPYVGLLSMTYGDGLAPITGKRWGKRKPFRFATDKTLVGTVTVGLVTLVITVVAILVFEGDAGLSGSLVLRAVAIGLVTAVFGSYIELTGSKGCDNLTLPIGTGLTAMLLAEHASPALAIYLTTAMLLLVIAYKLRAITPDGIVAAMLTALTLFTLGDVWVGLSLLLFFVLGSAVSKIKNEGKRRAEAGQESSGPRNWIQVLANSLPASLVLWSAVFWLGHDFVGLLAITVFAAAAADTFSSELGMLSGGKVFHILTGKPVPAGLSGGVSWAGFAAGLLGSFLLALLALPNYGAAGLLFATLVGFAGSLLDSVLGSVLQRGYRNVHGQLQDRHEIGGQPAAKGLALISNNAVNLITLSILVLAAQLLYYLQFLTP